MRRHCVWLRGGVALLLAIVASAAIANVPKEIGPQGFLLWDQPRARPELLLEDGDGKRLTLESFRGKMVLLNIWATWCLPCREEMPTLDALQAELGGGEFEVVALSIDKAGMGVVKDFYREIGIEHLGQYIDILAIATSTLHVVGIPTTLLLDRQGRELGRLVGETKWDSPAMIRFLREMIER